MTSPTTYSDHPVAIRLREAGITEAVVIDDAYDPPVKDDLSVEIAQFWAELIRDEGSRAELNTLKPEVTNEDDIDEELIGGRISLTAKPGHGDRPADVLQAVLPFILNRRVGGDFL